MRWRAVGNATTRRSRRARAEFGGRFDPAEWRTAAEQSDHGSERWLARERPRGRRAAEKRDERAAIHTTNSSARNKNGSGIARPSALAVVRLTTSRLIQSDCRV